MKNSEILAAKIILENVLDTLIEVGNGTTYEMLHEACDELFRFRDMFDRIIADEVETHMPIREGHLKKNTNQPPTTPRPEKPKY
jgi:hypothetical protein